MFPWDKSFFRAHISLENISRDMANKTFQPLEKCSKAKPPYKVSLLSLSSDTFYYRLSTFLNYQGLAQWSYIINWHIKNSGILHLMRYCHLYLNRDCLLKWSTFSTNTSSLSTATYQWAHENLLQPLQKKKTYWN